jgi:hypothetical protein
VLAQEGLELLLDRIRRALFLTDLLVDSGVPPASHYNATIARLPPIR